MSANQVDTILGQRILVVEPTFKNRNSIYTKLSQLGIEKIELLSSTLGLAAKVAVMKADVLVLSLDSIDANVLAELIEIKNTSPLAVVVFASQYRPEMTKTILLSGVSSFIVDDVASERLPIILDLAIERFSHSESLNKELQRAQQQLSDRKLVEKAKGIIMHQKNINEDQAYKQIRSSAMNEGKTMGVLSQQIISVYEMMA